MVGASAFIAGTSLIAKVLGLGADGLHPLQVSAGRFAFALMILAPIALIMRPGFVGTDWRQHLARSTCGWLGVTCLFAAAARIPLSDATAISFLSPLVTMGLAILLLGERVGPWRWLAAAIAVCGALVLIRPGTDAFQPAAVIALGAAAFMGLEAIFIKRLSGREPPIRILLVNNAMGATIACAAASFVWVAPTTDQWLLLALLGATMVMAQTLFIQAMKRADASFVIPFFYTTLVFATVYDLMLFGVVPTPVGLAGAGLIVAGVLLLAFRQRRHERPGR